LNDPVYFWHNQNKFNLLLSPEETLFNTAMDKYDKAKDSQPIDYPIHYHVFTPESFLILLYNMTSFSLFPFTVKEFYYTRVYSQEFCCVLELNKDLLEDKQEILNNKNNIVKILNKNFDGLIYYNSRKLLRNMLFLPFMAYRLLRKIKNVKK